MVDDLRLFYDDLRLPDTPLLRPDEERAYLEVIHLGCDGSAHASNHDCWHREQFALRNMRLVLSCARRFVPSDRDERFADVVSAGIVGLLIGIDRFDVNLLRNGRPMRFSTYGVWWIQSLIREELGRTDARVIRHKSYHQAFAAAKRELEILSGAPVDDPRLVFDFLRRCCGWTELKCARLRADLNNHVVSLAAFDKHEEQTFDVPSDDPGPLRQLIATEGDGLLRDAMRELEFVEIYVLSRHYFGAESHQEIGADINLSRERVRQIENVALRKLWLALEHRLSEPD